MNLESASTTSLSKTSTLVDIIIQATTHFNTYTWYKNVKKERKSSEYETSFTP